MHGAKAMEAAERSGSGAEKEKGKAAHARQVEDGMKGERRGGLVEAGRVAQGHVASEGERHGPGAGVWKQVVE